MTVQIGSVAQHPTARLVAGLCALLAEHADAPVWTMTPAEVGQELPALAEVLNQLAGLQLQMLRHADHHQVGDPSGHANTAGWWATVTRCTRASAHRQVNLAARLDDATHAPTAAAMAAGGVSVEQAAVILDAVDALPAELVGADVRRRAEDHLVELAAHHDPKELRILGRRILEVIAPDVAEDHERRILEDQERHAAATASFTMRSDGLGSVYGRFKIPVLAGEMLAKHLAAIAAPRHRHAVEGGDDVAARETSGSERVSRPLRLGAAFTEYIETRAASGSPQAGGLAATIAVTMTLENLVGASERAAVLDTGESISAAEARRLACEAGIIPAVLGGVSQPLDIGRKARFHTEPQRTALALRDRGCAEEHCDWPPGMCHAHHRQPWSRGGGTSVKNGVLLCPRHHTLAHDNRYQMKSAKDGKVVFTRLT